MPWVIQEELGRKSYYAGPSGIGPRFGATLREAQQMPTKEVAMGVLARFPAVVLARLVRVTSDGKLWKKSREGK